MSEEPDTGDDPVRDTSAERIEELERQVAILIDVVRCTCFATDWGEQQFRECIEGKRDDWC